VFVVNAEYFRLNDVYIVLYGDGKWFSRDSLHIFGVYNRKSFSTPTAYKIFHVTGLLLIFYCDLLCHQKSVTADVIAVFLKRLTDEFLKKAG